MAAGIKSRSHVCYEVGIMPDKTRRISTALKQADDGDYEFTDDATSCWITVGNVSVYIQKTKRDVTVDLYPAHCEMNEPHSSAAMSFKSAQRLQEKQAGITDAVFDNN